MKPMLIVAEVSKKKKNPGGRPKTVFGVMRLTIWLDQEAADRLKDIAEKERRSYGDVIRRALLKP